MKIVIIGGGPGGLYFALLMKKRHPAYDITVYERNRRDDTFGFGVVFSDETLDNLMDYDSKSYNAITRQFSYWDEIDFHFHDEVVRSTGHGFCGTERRTLLMILQDRCTELGVRLHFSTGIDDIDRFADADLIVAADGINSMIRERYRDHFEPQIELRRNHFIWLGSTAPTPAFSFYFTTNEFGIWDLCTYQYKQNLSTWVIEAPEATWKKAEAFLSGLNETETVAYLEKMWAHILQGHRLIANRSYWRQFPVIRNKNWYYKNIVLLGDALHSAHFSIGSGTKLAMEDAIALYEAFRKTGGRSVAAALTRFEAERREEVEKTQHSADVSLVWFEHVRRFWNMDPTRFAFGLMTRSKAITYDNLALRAPEFVKLTDTVVAHDTQALGFEVDTAAPAPPMFQPFRLRSMALANRVVVSPMDQYSAVDGLPTDWHMVHYGSRAIGGAGLMFTEMTCVSEPARITTGCTGLYNDAQEAAWKRIADFVHINSSTKFCLQLGHAGRKGATKLMWEGMDEPLPEGAWPIMAASPLPYYPHSQVPREMTRADMDAVIADFVQAVQRGERAGFDMVELHAAHGYLLASFISPLTNLRKDEYGGAIENRMRFPLEVFRAMRAAWPKDKPMSVRMSATDWQDGGLTGAESVAVARLFAEAGCDLIDVSTGQTTPEAEPVYGRMFQTPFSDRIRNEAKLATMCVGNITTADQVNTIIAAGRADLVALARPHLVDPFFTMKAAAWYAAAGLHCPPQYLPGQEQIFRNSARDREELTALRRKSKPKAHADTWKQAAE
jgi:anthraniloyl-CoA monooxygenase